MLSSILSFVKNPFPTASRYIKMSSKNTQPVKNLSEVNTLVNMYLLLYLCGWGGVFVTDWLVPYAICPGSDVTDRVYYFKIISLQICY